MKRSGFSLVELLLVVGIIALLAAILFPVFASSQGKARQTVCASNLRQLGAAVALYAQDYDDLFPRGGDPADLRTVLWENHEGGKYWTEAQQLRPLPDVLQPYLSSRQVWHCPSDIGFPREYDGDVRELGAASPSSYDVYGTSYYYHTALVFQRQRIGSVTGYEADAPHQPHGPSDILLLYDGAGYWHGDADYYGARYNTLMVDGHVTSLTEEACHKAGSLKLSLP